MTIILLTSHVACTHRSTALRKKTEFKLEFKIDLEKLIKNWMKKKRNWKNIKKLLKQEDIKYLYHFTDKKNIKSIKKKGGLFSWEYCEKNDINIKKPGGDEMSRGLDRNYNLQNYVRLSFVKNHPMLYVAKNQGRINNPVILRISLKVIYKKGTRFSNMNATRTGHKQGKSIKDLKRIKFDLIKKGTYVYLPKKNKPYYQAEVMVKSFIPLKYIKFGLMIIVDSRRKSKLTLEKLYPDAIYADVTSKAKDSLVKLSPFYPHGNIPIPYSNMQNSVSVEGIWQGLKVFKHFDIDMKSFENDKMKNIKRTVRKYGIPIGHRKGILGDEILDYIEARILIYLPSYLWILENKVSEIILRLREASRSKDIVLLDYTTNGDVLDGRKPLSHAQLIKAYVEGNYPDEIKFLNEYEKLKKLKTEDNIGIKDSF